MRPSISQLMWTSPDLPMSPAFHRMSFALFRTDGDTGRIIAHRTPDRPMVCLGHYIHETLALDHEAVTYMTQSLGGSAPLFVLTRTGIGLLSSRYSLTAGLGLYLHIHTRPVAAARLINSGVLGSPEGTGFLVSKGIRDLGSAVTSRDERSYPALLTAWEAVRAGANEVFSVDVAGCLTLSDLKAGISAMADFVGCGVSFTLPKISDCRGDPRNARIRCYRPRALEAILFCLLSEVRDRSETRHGVFRLDPPSREEGGLSLTLRYPLHPGETPESKEFYGQVHRHLMGLAETWGLDLYAPTRLLRPGDPDGLPEVTVSLNWLLDPAVLSSSDIKARLSLARDEGGREGEPPRVGETPWDDGF